MSTRPDMRRKRQSLGAPITDSKPMEKDNLRRKGSRSKSIGPGGLDALQQTSGNRRASFVPSFQPRSILKPRASLAPEGNETENLIDLDFRDNMTMTGAGSQANPSADTIPGSKIALRTEEEQQAAAREREERERKEARRKSLGANRRVSFAAEATLYTFHEIEYVQDSTGSTEASRRASSAAQQPPNGTDGERPSENRSEHNRRRRSSVQSAADLDSHDNTMASSAYSSDSDAADAVEEVEDHEDSGSSSDSDDSDGGTMMTIEGDEMTSASVASEADDSEIDDALRLAAQHAGTQQLDNDDGFDDEEEVIPSFGWIKKGPAQAAPPSEPPTPQPPAHNVEAENTVGMDMDMDMDMTSAGGRVINPRQQAGAEDDGDMSMDVTKAFGTIMGQNQRDATTAMRDMSPSNDDDDASMDFTIADGGVRHPPAEDETFHDDEEMSMELTSVMGGVLGIKKPGASRRRTMNRADQTMNVEQDMDLTVSAGRILSSQPAGNENQSPKPASSRRRTMTRADQTMNIEQDMDLTMGAGRILSSQPSRSKNESAGDGDGDGDATMDMDVAMAPGKILPSVTVAKSIEPADDDITAGMDMDVTMAPGKILPSAPAQAIEPVDEDATAEMDMTAAAGDVFYPQLDSRLAAKSMLQDEVNQPDSPSKPHSANRSPARRQTTVAASSTTEKTGSPSLSAFRGNSLRRSMPSAALEPSPGTPQTPTRSASPPKQRATTPRRSSRTPSPAKPASPPKQRATTPIRNSSPTKPASPSKQRSTTPKRTPSPAKEPTPRRITRSQSPQRKTPDSRSSQQQDFSKSGSLWVDDPKTGSKTPAVVLTPLQRQLSGRGVDREGLGSPRVSALLDRRTSIGDSSETFSPGKASNKRRVAFEDPRVLEEEVDKERKDDEEEENRRKQAGGPDEKEVTLNLKEMIASMSPKKNPLRGRKSLHVGSARGVLGKRPAELDSDEEDEWDGVKRLKNHQSSPVKNIRLQQPPSKEETTSGRLTRSTQSMERDKENVTPPPNESSGNRATTPSSQNRIRSVGDDTVSRAVDFDEPTVRREESRDDDANGRVHLQDFLDMISVKFMELTTSKRRQTQMPTALPDGEDDMSLERCVVAGACTVPMLELYQHSCRELKKYISEGRSIVKEIESETFEDNPPLFREYMSATPDFKMLMDNQFKNVKTHARLLSKAMWYEWRMKLQDGLKEGLVRIRGEMEEDDESLKRQQELLDSVLPGILARYEELAKEHADLEMYAEELAECDPEELRSARDELVGVESDIEAKKREIAELRSQLEGTESEIEQVSSRKQECLEEIKEAEKIREECRGWSTTEINLHKARVEALEKEHGWSVTGASGTQVSLAYKRAIELVFDVSSFKQGQPASRIDVWYIATNRDGTAGPVTPEREFFLQLIRDCVRALPQSRTRISGMLGMVRAAWDAAERVAKDVRVANVTFPTKVTRTSDSSIAVVSSLMMTPLGTRVEVTLNVRGVVSEGGVQVSVEPAARVCYGENFNVEKIAEFLAGRIGPSGEAKEGAESWSDVFVSLHERLLARGKKEELRGE